MQTKASLTSCPACGAEMALVEKTTMTGDDMRTYRCERCATEHIVNFGPALWKVLSDAREADAARRAEEENLRSKAAAGHGRRGTSERGNKFYVMAGVLVTVCLVVIVLLVSSLLR